MREMKDIVLMRDPEGFLKPDQVRLLLKVCENDTELILVSLLWRTGARISEILQLKKKSINLEQQTITIPTLKRKKPLTRTITIEPSLFDKLRSYVENMDDESFLFTFDRFKAYRIVQKLGKRAGIVMVGKKLLHPHNFRHSFSIHAVKSGVPVPILKNLLGHASIHTTGFYLQFSDEESRDYLKKMWKKG